MHSHAPAWEQKTGRVTTIRAGHGPRPYVNMTYNPEIHHRRSIRLKDYDYAQAGAYFATICVWQRECLFGDIRDGEMNINECGDIVRFTWNDLVNHNSNLLLGNFVIMPNHFHGIIVIDQEKSVGSAKVHGLQEIVRQFKTFSAKRINAFRNAPGVPVWQRNYYEHVIRNDEDCNRIVSYISINPQKWAEDTLHPLNNP